MNKAPILSFYLCDKFIKQLIFQINLAHNYLVIDIFVFYLLILNFYYAILIYVVHSIFL